MDYGPRQASAKFLGIKAEAVRAHLTSSKRHRTNQSTSGPDGQANLVRRTLVWGKLVCERSQNEDRLHAGNIASLQEHRLASRRLAKIGEIRCVQLVV